MPMPCRRALLRRSICALSLLAAWFAGTAQTRTPPAADATFRAGTQEVLVDAVVTDKNSNFRSDLTRQDFRIFEDGKEQPITSFALEGAGSRRSTKHFIALVFDAEFPGLRDQVGQFVDRFASPDLYLAVFSRVNSEMRLQQPFTSDASRIKSAIGAMQIVPPTPPARDVFPGGPARDGIPFLNRISGVAAAIAPARGRKALILFTIGIYGSHQTGAFVRTNRDPTVGYMQKTIDDCNAANVSVYSFVGSRGSLPSGRGIGGFYDPPTDPRDDHGAQTDFVQDLVEGTGGRYMPPGTYDLASYLRSAFAAPNDYYLLGYVPAAESTNKPCHKLRVKVAGSGLKVEARDSYCSNVPVSQVLTPAQRALEALAASDSTGTIRAGMQLSWFYSRPNAAVVDIAMDLDPAAFKLHGLHGEFNVSGAAYRPDGSVAARIGDTVAGDFETKAQLDAFLKTSYHYSKQFDLAPGQYRFRVAFGSADRAFGSAERTLEIDPWDGKALSASAIALAAQDYPLTDAAAELDNSLLEGLRRLASKGRAIIPMGGVTFRRGGNALMYLEVYDPSLSQPPSPAPPVTLPVIRIRILDRASAHDVDSFVTDAALWIRPGDSVIPIALHLPIGGLSPGAYTLEAQVAHASGQDTVIRRADFDLK